VRPTLTVVADELNDPLEFEVVVASLRLGSQGLSGDLDALGTKLCRALPGQVEVSRRGLLRKNVWAVSADLGDRRYRIEVRRPGLRCSVASVVRGVVLRTDELDVEEWFQRLSRDLVSLAERSIAVRTALDELSR
jgi:hypothetical protein